MSLRNFPTVKDRRKFLENEINADLSQLVSPLLEENASVHCENLIGSTQIPLGVAGPVTINSLERFIPLATTEGALVASVSRGCKAITLSGGATSFSVNHGQTRGPVFRTENIEQGIYLKNWIVKNVALIAKKAQSTSNHISYKGAKVKIIGNYTFVRFSFDTKDAMGMNMVTIATEAIAELIEEKTKIKCIATAGNFDTDKKPSYMNAINGRGFEVWSEAVITKKVLKEVLHTTAKDLYDVWIAKCMIGSYAAGSLGFNSHFANMVAAIFIATGQDPAHVVEGSNGITTCEVKGSDLYISVNLPSLLVGTVGGGTALPSQKTALSIMKITSNTKSPMFAEIVAAGVLAGELSLLASITTRTLGKAHQALGRKKV